MSTSMSATAAEPLSSARLEANRANATKSTGPITEMGKSKSSRNAVRHGLAARETNLFFNDPEEQITFLAHKLALRKQLLPIGELEEKFFHLHAFSLFQAERSQIFELACEDAWLDDQSNPVLIGNLQRMARYGEIHERRAARSLNELRKLQLDRFAATEVAQYVEAQDEFVPISAALPMAQIRKGDFNRTNPSTIADNLIDGDPEVKMRPKTKVEDQPKVDWQLLYSLLGEK